VRQIDVINYLIGFGGVALIGIGAYIYVSHLQRLDARERDAARRANADASARPTG